MHSWADLFKDKKITVMGLGLLGSAVGDARFFAECGADVVVTDLKSEEQLEKSVKELRKFKNISFTLGKHDKKDFKNKDFILKAGGVPLDSEYLTEARKNNIPIQMSTALFAKLTPASIVGITGTRGKSTVAQLVYEILALEAKQQVSRQRRDRELSAKKVFLGGNVKGVSTLELLPFATQKDIVVLELDSWRLQGFGGTHFSKMEEDSDGYSPHIAVFTNLMSDHMNYYKGDMKRYFADKSNIYRFQNEKDVLVVSKDIEKWINKYGPKPKGKLIIAEETQVPKNWKIKIPGKHNRQNIAVARAVAKSMGISDAVIKKAVEAFKAMPGRLELVRKYKGIEIYNDTNATTPTAAAAALTSFTSIPPIVTPPTAGLDNGKNKIVLIFGGADKLLDEKPFFKLIPQYVKAGVVLPGTGTDKVKKELEKIGKKIPLTYVKDMRSAVAMAVAKAKKGDKILLSPGFASFGLFVNEYDRGEQFVRAVKALK